MFLACATLLPISALAETKAKTITLSDVKKNVAVEVKDNKNLKEIVTDLQDSIPKENFSKKDTHNSNASTSGTTTSSAVTASVTPIQNQPVPLTQFGILAYEDNTWQYTAPGYSISRSNLPIDFIAFQAGTSYSQYIQIDGTTISPSLYSYEKNPYQTDEYNRVVSWLCYSVINENVISSLPNGLHTVTVTTSSYDKYTTGGTTITDDFSFNLTD